MPKAIFKGVTFAAAGSLPKSLTEDQLRQWATIRKGSFTKEWDESVTHLLFSDDDYKTKNKNKRIKEALQRKRTVRLLHYDWFEFSCVKNKRLPEGEFTVDHRLAKEREKLRKQRNLERRRKNLVVGETWFNPDLYRIFMDRYKFEYKVELLRTREDEFGVYHEKYNLLLYQSFAKPPLYGFGVKLFQKTNNSNWRPCAIDRPSECPGQFKPHFSKFKEFFRIQTGIDWPDRIVRAGTTDKSKFQYQPPTHGKPVGGNLTPGLTPDECFEQNRQLRCLWYDLFDDHPGETLIAELTAEAVLEEILALLEHDEEL